MSQEQKAFIAGFEGEQVHWITSPSLVKLREVVSLGYDEALKLNHSSIGIELLLLGLMWDEQGPAANALKQLGVDPIMLIRTIESALSNVESKTTPRPKNIRLTKAADKVLRMAVLEGATITGNQGIGPEHLLLSILRSRDNLVTQLLNQYDVNYEAVKRELLTV